MVLLIQHNAIHRLIALVIGMASTELHRDWNKREMNVGKNGFKYKKKMKEEVMCVR